MVFGDPLTEVAQIRSGVVAAALSLARAAPKPVEQTHRGSNPFLPLAYLLR
jgi:hypothetical protein